MEYPQFSIPVFILSTYIYIRDYRSIFLYGYLKPWATLKKKFVSCPAAG